MRFVLFDGLILIMAGFIGQPFKFFGSQHILDGSVEDGFFYISAIYDAIDLREACFLRELPIYGRLVPLEYTMWFTTGRALLGSLAVCTRVICLFYFIQHVFGGRRSFRTIGFGTIGGFSGCRG
jgi:hypothetical protein